MNKRLIIKDQHYQIVEQDSMLFLAYKGEVLPGQTVLVHKQEMHDSPEVTVTFKFKQIVEGE